MGNVSTNFQTCQPRGKRDAVYLSLRPRNQHVKGSCAVHTLALVAGTVCPGGNSVLAVAICWLSLPLHAASRFDIAFVQEKRPMTYEGI